MQENLGDFILQEANVVAAKVISPEWNALGNVSNTGWYFSLSNSTSPEKGNIPFEWQAKEFKRITVIVFVVVCHFFIISSKLRQF